MNDTELAAALRAIHREAAAIADPPSLRARVQAIPTQRPSGSPRRWAWSTRRWESRQVATRLIAVVAIVAVGTGTIFLAASQGPSPLPKIAPSPTVWTLPSGFVSEEVEPGVLRVLHDGIRDLTFPDEMAPDGIDVATGLDGSVWLFLGTRIIRLGADRTIDQTWSQSWRNDYEIGVDGTLWAAPTNGAAGADGDLAAFRGDAWTRYRGSDGQVIHQVEVLRDGSIWASWWVGSEVVVVGRLDNDTWSIEGELPHLPGVRHQDQNHLSVSDNGDIWVGAQRLGAENPDAVPIVPGPGEGAGIAPDGTFWTRGAGGLARVDARGLTTYDEADGIPGAGAVGEGRPGEFVVAPDGSLWVTANGGRCNSRILHFDGSTWVERSQCGVNIDVAPDGALWFTGIALGAPFLHVIPPAPADG